MRQLINESNFAEVKKDPLNKMMGIAKEAIKLIPNSFKVPL